VAAELFAEMTSLKLVPVHYKGGGDLMQDLLSGEVKLSFSTVPPVKDFIENGQLQALATTRRERDRMLPNTPTLDEAGLRGYELSLWLALLAPRGTPSDVVEKLSTAMNAAITSPDVKAALEVQGFSPLTGNTRQFDAFMKSEIMKWGNLIKHVGIVEP
jgi:tripartite-type tricarboxylate transporter receptor subunit TctC